MGSGLSRCSIEIPVAAVVLASPTLTIPKVADAVIEQLNGKDFGGSTLRVERSERRESGGNNRRGGAPAPMGAGQPQVARKTVNKVVHSDAPGEGAPDPRWAGELSKLKDLLGNQKTAV
jgi:hypothetical protein